MINIVKYVIFPMVSIKYNFDQIILRKLGFIRRMEWVYNILTNDITGD